MAISDVLFHSIANCSLMQSLVVDRAASRSLLCVPMSPTGERDSFCEGSFQPLGGKLKCQNNKDSL